MPYGGAVIFIIVLALRGGKGFKIAVRNIPLFLGLGLGSVLFFTVCYFKSIEMLPLSIAAILLYTSPIWVTLMSVLFFKERLTLRRVAALVLAFGGCVLVSGLGGGGLTPLGLLIGLCSGIGYGLYSILGSVALRKYEPLTVTTYAFLFSAAGSWFICRPAEMLSIASSLPPLSFALDVLSIAVVTAVAPYLLYTLGLKNTPASKAAIMATVEPLVATVLGIVVFSEPLYTCCGSRYHTDTRGDSPAQRAQKRIDITRSSGIMQKRYPEDLFRVIFAIYSVCLQYQSTK